MNVYLLQSRSTNTVNKYCNYFQSWVRWAVRFGIVPLPASDHFIALFLVSLLQQGSSCHVIASVIYSIKWTHAIRGFDDPTRHLSRNILECAKRIAKPRRQPKEPLTPEILKAIHHFIGGSDATLLNLRKFVFLLLSYVGFLRFDEASTLKVDDITFFDTHMTLFIEHSKTDVYREGRTLIVSKVASAICPVETLLCYIRQAHLDHDSFLFRPLVWVKTRQKYRVTGSNRALSYTTCRLDALGLFSKIGLNPTDFGLHSARSGGASWAANAGVPDRLFKRHGRWVSDRAKDSYVKDNLFSLISVTQNLGL